MAYLFDGYCFGSVTDLVGYHSSTQYMHVGQPFLQVSHDGFQFVGQMLAWDDIINNWLPSGSPFSVAVSLCEIPNWSGFIYDPSILDPAILASAFAAGAFLAFVPAVYVWGVGQVVGMIK
jgi:hypothetical protein